MAIKDLILKLIKSDNKKHITHRISPEEGVDFIFSSEAIVDAEGLAISDLLFGMQLTYLRGLHEQGLAEKNANGYTVLSETVAEQEDYFFDLFTLYPSYDGSFKTDIRGNTAQAAFSVTVKLLLSDKSLVENFKLLGPFIQLSENEIFRLSPAELKALKAVENHRHLPDNDRGEYENNWLIFELQLAKKAGMDIDLCQFEKLELVHPESVGVAVEEAQDGSLILTPTFGNGLNLEDIKSRLGQFDNNTGHAILRVKDRFVLLDEERLEASHEILTTRRIPKDQVQRFLKTPTAYLNSSLIDLDTGFSLRVHGAEKFTHRYFGDVEKSGLDWFSNKDSDTQPFSNVISSIDSDDDLKEVKQKVIDAKSKGAEVIEHEGHTLDISNDVEVNRIFEKAREKLDTATADKFDDVDTEQSTSLDRAVVAIDSNDEEAQFTRAEEIEKLSIISQTFDTQNLKRTPFEHQDEGIKWLLAHYELALKTESDSGALLADDMGLGKTFMTLVSIAEWYKRCKANNETQKPVLIVAPLSLLENWQAEVFETFHKSPFNEIVILQSGADLKRFKIAGAKREIDQDFDGSEVIEDSDNIRYSLKVGKHYDDRLDKPGRLVLTTYQTLRDYQFSMSLIQWSIVAFDEAQNIKNPNALATRAAKALNSDFKLLATGTPVENSLRDFWCLMDTAVPGLVGAWQAYRKDYIVPITSSESDVSREKKIEVGKDLRQRVGNYMLRRTKEENLKGLPEKKIFSGAPSQKEIFQSNLSVEMSGEQLLRYDDIILSVKQTGTEDKRKVILPSLGKLKLVSIHHDLLNQSSFSSISNDLVKKSNLSCKIRSLMTLLDEINKRDEKVLIFATTKVVQSLISALVTHKYKINVETINGDTKAVATKKSDDTRKGIIDKFQTKPGFGVIVMSPIAAGVGLTVTAANNVIHLERHWNPAKEAQATDRVYRIGQTKPVNVYIPIATHPKQKSFDVQLSQLLGNKIDLSNAVVAPEIVDVADLLDIF